MDSLHARVSTCTPSAMDKGFNAPRAHSNIGKVNATPLKAHVNVGTCPELFHSKIDRERRNALPKKVHPRLRSVSSQPSLPRTAPSATLSSPLSAHAKTSGRKTVAETPRTKHEWSSETGFFICANTMHASVAEPEPLKSIPSLLPPGKISEPVSRPFSVRASTDKVNKPVRVHVNQRSGPKMLPSALSPKQAVSTASKQNVRHVSLYPQQDSDKVQSASRSPSHETYHTGCGPITSASLAQASFMKDQQEHKSAPSPIPFPVLGMRTAPAASMLPSDASSAWTDHKNQSAPGTLSPLSLNHRMHNELSLTSSTPNELTMEEASHILDARHARKLLDLEISNKSLLAINATLESSKVKLTKELRELRHNMLVGKTNSEANHGEQISGSIRTSLDELLHPMSGANEKDSLGEEVLRIYTQQDQETDTIYRRCCAKIDELLKEARSAILAKPVLDAAPGGKILHPSELRHDTLDDTLVNATLTEGHLMMRLKDNL